MVSVTYVASQSPVRPREVLRTQAQWLKCRSVCRSGFSTMAGACNARSKSVQRHQETRYDRLRDLGETKGFKRTSSVVSVTLVPSQDRTQDAAMVRLASDVSVVTVTPEPAPKKRVSACQYCNAVGHVTTCVSDSCRNDFCGDCTFDHEHCYLCWPVEGS